MKSKIVLGGLLAAGALAFGLTAPGEAVAQPMPPYYPGVGLYPAPGLPPHEVVAIVRSTGLEPLSGPMRHGPTYALRAIDPYGREFRVFVDARFGRVLRAVPLEPRYALPVAPPYGRVPGPVAMAPDGYGPSSRIAALPPGVAGAPPANGPAVPGAPGHTPAVGAAPSSGVKAGPPLPRPRPKIAATDSSALIDAPPQASQASPPAQDAVKETKDTMGSAVPSAPPAPAAVTLPAQPVVTPQSPPAPALDEQPE